MYKFACIMEDDISLEEYYSHFLGFKVLDFQAD